MEFCRFPAEIGWKQKALAHKQVSVFASQRVSEKATRRLRFRGRIPGKPVKYPRFPEVVSRDVVRRSGISVEKANLDTLPIFAVKPFFSRMRSCYVTSRVN
jgi:hypothetical protein